MPAPSDPRYDWLRSHPGVRGFAVVSAGGEPETVVGETHATSVQQQVYLAMLARRVGEELGLAQLTDLTAESSDARLLITRQRDGRSLHVQGTTTLDYQAIRRGLGDDR